MSLAGTPTIAEAGYPDLAADIWTAVLVPAGTPKEITLLLQGEIAKLMQQPDVRDRMVSFGFQPVANTPDECAVHITAETAKWSKVIREAGIKVR